VVFSAATGRSSVGSDKSEKQIYSNSRVSIGPVNEIMNH
jgi:hypothetical protein